MTDQPATIEPTAGANIEPDSELARFMNIDVLMDEPAPVSPVEPDGAPPASPNDTTPAPTPEPSAPATPAADTGTPQPGAPQPSPDPQPDLMADMLAAMGGAPAPEQPAPTPAPVPAPVAAPAPAAETPASPEETVYFTPNQLTIPPALESALFESENPQQRNEALRVLLSTVMNASAQEAIKQVRQSVLPGFAESQSQQFVQAQRAMQVNNDLFGAYPDLAKYPQVAAQAARVIAQRHPDMQWGPAALKQVGDLAMQFVQRTIPAAVPAAPPALMDPSARPAAPLTTGVPTPESELNDLLQF